MRIESKRRESIGFKVLYRLFRLLFGALTGTTVRSGNFAAMPGSVASEYVHIVLGVLLFIAPWVLGYSALAGASWTSWIGGILAVIVGAVAIPSANVQHRLVAQH